jgi:hypothetical protein
MIDITGYTRLQPNEGCLKKMLLTSFGRSPKSESTSMLHIYPVIQLSKVRMHRMSVGIQVTYAAALEAPKLVASRKPLEPIGKYDTKYQIRQAICTRAEISVKIVL